MVIKQVIKSQYGAALEMLKTAVEKAPDALWNDPSHENRFWYTAYHTLFYTHFYLHAREEDYEAWQKHRPEVLANESNGGATVAPYSREDILECVAFTLGEMPKMVDALDLEAESGFYWLPFDKLELQVYSIRHIQQHAGELNQRLMVAGIEIPWVGMTAVGGS